MLSEYCRNSPNSAGIELRSPTVLAWSQEPGHSSYNLRTKSTINCGGQGRSPCPATASAVPLEKGLRVESSCGRLLTLQTAASKSKEQGRRRPGEKCGTGVNETRCAIGKFLLPGKQSDIFPLLYICNAFEMRRKKNSAKEHKT